MRGFDVLIYGGQRAGKRYVMRCFELLARIVIISWYSTRPSDGPRRRRPTMVWCPECRRVRRSPRCGTCQGSGYVYAWADAMRGV